MEHKVRMEAKRKFRQHIYETEFKYSPNYIPANLGRNHPDYGLSMADHLVEKAKRSAEKSS